MITHNMQHAVEYADRIVVLSGGTVVKEFKKGVKVCDLIEAMAM